MRWGAIHDPAAAPRVADARRYVCHLHPDRGNAEQFGALLGGEFGVIWSLPERLAGNDGIVGEPPMQSHAEHDILGPRRSSAPAPRR